MEKSQNKMGTMPVNKLLLSMSLPMVISMLVQALYNVVDSIFVSQVSEDAMTAVSLAFPIQNFMIAVGSGIGVGINAMISKSLGEKNQKLADKSAMNGLFIFFCGYLLFIILALFLVKPFLKFQLSNSSETNTDIIFTYGSEYLFICLMFSFGLLAQFLFERLLQSTGRTFYTMITQGIGAVINIILDPILIFGYFGFPRLEIKGAAIATVIGQIIAGILAIIFNLRKNPDIHLSLKGFRPDGSVIKKILSVGIPSTIMVSVSSVMVFLLNKLLISFSSTAVTVFGVYFKLQSFVFMPVFGLNNGMIPIVSYNFGAKDKKRMMQTIKLSLVYSVSLMVTGLIIIQCIPEKLLMLFDASENMLSIGVPALRIICLSFPLAGVCIIVLSVFQAVGNGVLSMIVSLSRQLLILIPTAYLLSLLGNIDYVWFAFPIAEAFAFTLALILLRRIYVRIIKPLGQS